MSRRNALRLAGAGFAAAAVGGAASGFAAPAAAAGARVRLQLDKGTYAQGEVMTLTVTQDIPNRRHTRVTDSDGQSWRKVSHDDSSQRWQAVARTPGTAIITWTTRVPTATGTKTHTATTNVRVSGTTLIGMSASAGVWQQRASEVGSGLSARRIFADLRAGADDQMALVEQAHAAGLMPVISYKVGGDAAGAAAGRFNAVAEKAAARLESFGLPATVTYWHEPYGDLSPAQFIAGNKQLLPIFKGGHTKVGPLLNGWLLDNKVSTFTSFCPDELFELWDWFGIDTYESGTLQSPGAVKPADRVPALAAYVASRGFEHRLGIGEYNGYSAKTVAAAGDAILAEPKVWFGCLWNSTIGKGYTLTGDRLEAFRETLSDPRCAAPR